MNSIEIQNLFFKYESPIFECASLTVKTQSIAGLIGPNGAGKTTLFDLICGIKKPDQGTVVLSSNCPAYLSQTISTSPALTLGDMFNMISALSISSPIAIPEVVERLGDWHPSLANKFSVLSNRRPSYCSYGEIRYYFTLTLLANPNDLILLDEPTAGVDPEHRYFIWHAITAAKQAGKTIVVSSHHLQEIADHTDMFWFVNQRQLYRFDSGEAFRKHYGGADLDAAFMNAARAP